VPLKVSTFTCSNLYSTSSPSAFFTREVVALSSIYSPVLCLLWVPAQPLKPATAAEVRRQTAKARLLRLTFIILRGSIRFCLPSLCCSEAPRGGKAGCETNCFPVPYSSCPHAPVMRIASYLPRCSRPINAGSVASGKAVLVPVNESFLRARLRKVSNWIPQTRIDFAHRRLHLRNCRMQFQGDTRRHHRRNPNGGVRRGKETY